LSFAVYKEDAVFLATRQAAIVAFDFQFVKSVPGPVSVNSIVEFSWGHVWLATDNAFYMFDGSTVTPLSRAAETTLDTTFHKSNAVRSHAFQQRGSKDEAWFFYPDLTDGQVTEAISIVMTAPAIAGERVVSVNHHSFATEISASAAWTTLASLTIDGLDTFAATIDDLDGVWPTIDAMEGGGSPASILGDSVGKFYSYGTALTDAGTAIPWEFTSPFMSPAGVENRFFVDGIASYWEKTTDALTVTLGLTPTDSVSDAGTETTDTFDLSTDSNHMTTFVNKRGKWLKVKHSGTSAVDGMRHRGYQVYVFPKGMV